MIEWLNISLHTDLIKYVAVQQEHTTNDRRKTKNGLINQGMKTTNVRYYPTDQESILSNIVTENNIYDNYNHTCWNTNSSTLLVTP